MSDILTILGAACILLGGYMIHPGLAVAAFGVGCMLAARASTVQP